MFCCILFQVSKSTYSDENLAHQTLSTISLNNNSYVYDLFQALCRSSLTCPNCSRQSNTFDPFLSLSLPIPQRCQRPVHVTVVYADASPKQVKIGLLLDQNESIETLRHTIATETSIPASMVCIYARFFSEMLTFFASGNLNVLQFFFLLHT